MSRFTDQLWQDLVQEHGQTLAHAERPQPGRVRFTRPRLLAGSSLGLAGIGAAAALALGAAGSAPAYAVTINGDGSVLVTLNQTQALPQVNAKLASMGTGEAITIQMANGAAPVSGAVTCTRAAGDSGPPVKVLNGTDGTEVIPSGNTGAGTWHLAACTASNIATGSGNTGAG